MKATKPWSVPVALASKARTVHAASKAGEAVFECRLIMQLLQGTGLGPEGIDRKLHELELAYHRRCDEIDREAKRLEKAKRRLDKKPPKKRAGKGRRR